MKELESWGYVRIPQLLSIQDTKLLQATISLVEQNQLHTEPAGLSDSGDMTNHLYSSKRSPGLRYAYLQSTRVQAVNRRVADALQRRTNLNWWTGINCELMPVFCYGNQAYIKAHRGRDIGFGDNNYVAVVMVTSPGIDFDGGEFYLNPHANASDDGKTVWNDRPKDRIHFDLQQGEVLVFDNRRFVHGTTPVSHSSSNSSPVRITCSWRTSAT